MNKFIVTIAFLLALPGMAVAETVVRSGDSISITEDQTIANDFYVLAESISMSGVVEGDMYAVGGVATVNGVIESDLTVLGGAVQVHASVTDDVRIVGGEVVLAEDVGGDVFVIGGVLKILSSATVAGDVYFFGGEAEIAGAVGGSVVGKVTTARIDAPVGGDVSMQSQAGLTIGSRAVIAGDVQYESPVELVRAQDAVIEGEMLTTASDAGNGFDWQSALVQLLLVAFAALSVYLVGKRYLRVFVPVAVSNYGINGLIGLLTLVVMPIVSLVLLISVLGIWLGIIGFAVYVAIVVLASIMTAIIAGSWLVYGLTKKHRVDTSTVCLGVIATQVVLYVPVVGGALFFALLCVVLGGLVRQGVMFARS